MIRVIFEITEQGHAVLIHGRKEYLRKTAQEMFMEAVMSPMCSKIMKDMATVHHAISPDVRGSYVQGGPDGSQPMLVGETGLKLKSKDGPAILCLRCGRVSYNPTDVVKAYCGACHIFHELS